jgi:diguanylate cyclase (GGDEF)-like protein
MELLKQRLQGWMRRLGSLLDSASLVADAAQPEQLRRVRILRSFVVVLVLLGLETSIVFRAGLPSPDLADRVDGCLVLALVGVYAALVLMRRTLRIDLAADIVLGSSLLVIVACLSVIGGIEAPLLHWLGLIPMLAVLLRGRRAALAWAGVSALTVLGLIAADAAGLDLGDAGIFEGVTRSRLWIYKLVDTSSWCLMFLAVSLLYEHIRLRHTAVVASKNRELEQEIRQRAIAEERTHRLAYYDELTGLPNRSAFQRNLERAMASAERTGSPLAVMLLDLDGFKSVNDTHGHAFGDDLLAEVARRLTACTRHTDHLGRRQGDVVSRLGGDEFTILIQPLTERREAAKVATRVLEMLRNPIVLGDQKIYISASIGVALHPGPADSIDSLLRSADMAMYHAKESGRNSFRFFEESMNDEVQRRTRLANELRQAIEQREFVLYYQPIVAAADGRITGAEALLRWRHPERGVLPPGHFIEVAEDTGLISPIGAWVLDEGSRQLAEWSARGLELGRLSINVSALQLRNGVITEQVSDILRRHPIEPAQLDLEITENAILVDELEADACLGMLKALGVRLTLDDFGTGYSSLSYVRRFSVDALKIDRSFTGDPDTDPEACGIAAAIVSMGRHLGLRTVGEGVETQVEADWLRACGCDELQGFLFARPMPADEFSAFVRAWAQRPLAQDAKDDAGE